METRTERAYQNIRRELISGELKPGQHLVSRALADRLGVSLAPVREAIGRLAVEGLVEHVPGSGTFVRTISKQDLYELYVLREALESCAAAEASINAHPVQLDELESICREFEAIAQRIPEGQNADQETMDRWVDCEERFHSLLFDATRNSLLQKMANNFRMQIQVFEVQRSSPKILAYQIAQETVRTHIEITQAIRQRDPESARARMLHHIQRGRQTVLDFFSGMHS